MKKQHPLTDEQTKYIASTRANLVKARQEYLMAMGRAKEIQDGLESATKNFDQYMQGLAAGLPKAVYALNAEGTMLEEMDEQQQGMQVQPPSPVEPPLPPPPPAPAASVNKGKHSKANGRA